MKLFIRTGVACGSADRGKSLNLANWIYLQGYFARLGEVSSKRKRVQLSDASGLDEAVEKMSNKYVQYNHFVSSSVCEVCYHFPK